MLVTRRLILSCDVFGGFECDCIVNPEEDTMKNLIAAILGDLELKLKENHLIMLLDILRNRKKDYHIHTHSSIKDILLEDSKIYVCYCKLQIKTH